MGDVAERRKRETDPAVKAGIRQRALQVGVTLLLQAAVLFLASGHLGWVWAWVFIGLYLAGIALNASLLLRYHQETVAERARSAGMKGWDRVVGGLWTITYFILLLLVAGLDERWGWSGPQTLGLHLAGAAAFALGLGLFSWSMVSNAYFATVVRIQKERGHQVCDQGPYRFVRHPGYIGAILQSLALPLLLGSNWALIPGGLAALLMAVRTALEDRMLQAELDGYREYTHKVHYRLLPGIW